VVTLAIGFGKGWYNFDVQSTFGVNVTTADSFHFGHPVFWNGAFQYGLPGRSGRLEINTSFWPNGNNDGQKQVFLTPGLVLGRFPIRNRLGSTVGGRVQIAATGFHQFNHNWILTLRMPF